MYAGWLGASGTAQFGGPPLLLPAEYSRLPYTSGAFQLDLNSRRWQFHTGHR